MGARKPIKLMTPEGVLLPGAFVWTRDNRGHGPCFECAAPAGRACMWKTVVPTYRLMVFVDEPFVHVGRL